MKTMDKAEAIRIVQALADGRDPETSQPLPLNAPYQKPPVLRALFFALKVLESDPHRPENVGKPWDKSEDERLCERFDSGVGVKELAIEHERSRNAIRSRLVKLGKIERTVTRQTSPSVAT
jgi:hypothetical protein